MKPLTTLLLLLALFALTNMSNCDGEDDSYLEPYTESSFTLLQVDYQTLDFEAGNFVPAAPVTTPADTLPIAVTYNSPGDFGDILLASTIDNDTVFFGTIVWAGTGQRISPAQLTPAADFQTIDAAAPLPTIKNLNPFGVDPEDADVAELWAAVADLQVVHDAVADPGSRFGFFTYARSVGVGNPAEWDYFVVIYRP